MFAMLACLTLLIFYIQQKTVIECLCHTTEIITTFATSQLANVVFVLTEVSKFDEALKDVIQIKSFKLLWNRSLLFFIMLIRWLWLRRGNLLLKQHWSNILEIFSKSHYN